MENVTDTEAVVNIKLDAHQNKLIAVNVISQGLGVINCEWGAGLGGRVQGGCRAGRERAGGCRAGWESATGT